MVDQQTRILRQKVLGALVRKARQDARKSLRETAVLLGTTAAQLAACERGQKSLSLPELELLAYHFEISLRQFWLAAGAHPQARSQLDPTMVLGLRHRVIGASLRMRRTAAGKHLRDVAEATGIPSKRIAAYERGERPIPLPDLEALAAHYGQPLEEYVAAEGPLGKWDARQQTIEAVLDFPEDLREFLSRPVNQPYVRLAKHLSELSVDKLRIVAEGLLDITF